MASHPLSSQLIIGIVLIVLSLPTALFAPEIRAFLAVPPQRIGTWVARARLNAADLRHRRARRRHYDITYFIAHYLRNIFFLLTLTLGSIATATHIGLLVWLRQMASQVRSYTIMIDVFLVWFPAYFALYIFFRVLRDLRDDIDYDTRKPRLAAKVERRKAALAAKGIVVNLERPGDKWEAMDGIV